MSDDAKKLVLARRARFVAAALAGISVACCGKDKASPFVCLDVPAPEDASATTPQVCLTAIPTPPPPPDASASAVPVPCLGGAPPPFHKKDGGK